MREPIAAALAELGVRRMLFAIHDISCPSDPDEDIGRGAPGTRASARLFARMRSLGFTGIQLGPQGQTSRSNPSPYDGSTFARHTGTIGLGMFRPGGFFEGLVDEATLDGALVSAGGNRARHVHAYDAMARILDAAHDAMRAGLYARELGEHVRELRRSVPWRDFEGLYAALSARHRGRSFREWPAEDARLWDPPVGAEAAYADRAARLLVEHAEAIDRHVVGQTLATVQHALWRRSTLKPLGLTLYGDFQVGYGEAEMWRYQSCFLRGYAMGAPPSRTNPDGQPWNYPMLDPAQLGEGGAARDFVTKRLQLALGAYDSLRIDHPHGLVCPWVYRVGPGISPEQSVREGARLYESPDLVDHPALARFALVRGDQLDRTRARHADGWVRELSVEQVEQYAIIFELVAAVATEFGLAIEDLSCEVLSTMPYPLGRVLARYGLGRWRITQKANLDDDTDVYRADNARPADWIMLGNHDTAPIRAVIAGWSSDKRAAWVRHLATTLHLSPAQRDDIAATDGMLATAMLAEAFACDAENVSIFWADLFGEVERFNAPGTVSDENWSLRLPADSDRLLDERLARRQALDIPLALAMALGARGSRSGVAAALLAAR